MPRVRREHLPYPLLNHLIIRVRERKITLQQLEALLRWLEANPIVPEGKWFKKFSGFVLCGEGEFVKTFLLPGQAVTGEEVTQ